MMTRASYSIDEWCQLHGLSRGTFYNLAKRGKAPRTFHIGRARRVSAEADAEWRQQLEAEARAERDSETEVA